MKTRIPIKRYTLDPDIRKTIEHLTGPDAGTGHVLNNAITVAQEYLRLEQHHKQETEFLITTITRLEESLDRQLANTISLAQKFGNND